MKKFKLIGLTGPTGAGKGETARCFEALGCAVIYTDSLAAEARKIESCKRALTFEFGDDIISESGEIITKTLAVRAFRDSKSTSRINEILHPHIFALSLMKIKEFSARGYKAIILDAPVLFESNIDVVCDAVVSILAPKASRIRRILERDNITENEAKLRVGAQNEDSFYEERSDFVIYNTGTIDELEKQVENIFKGLM